MNGNGNNQSRALWWLIGTATTLAMGIGAGTFTTLRANSERIAVLESQVNDTRQGLRRIEAKLDHLLENGRGR